ncbi:MAG: sulfatase [Opitutus sp.]|nr:sulfatase [Opitutus sp.]
MRNHRAFRSDVRRLAVFVLAVAGMSAFAADQPNILWITAEDLSPNLGCYGDTFARTPHLDAFAREAVRYTRAFSVAPVCAPSRVTLVTGVYANSLGNPHLRCEMTLPADFKGYPVYLREAGYFTTNNVKTDYNLRNEAEIVRAWWNRSDAQAHWRQRAPGQPFMAVFNLMETHQSRLSVWPEEQFEREIASRIPAGERADPARVPVPPFYPDNAAARKAMARYYDCITVMDRKVGAILRELEADGLAEDTIVFYYGDHGMGMPRGKRLLHDSGLRVPLLIRVPRKWRHVAAGQPRTTNDRLVNFVDFAPTLLSLAGAPIPAHYQGTAFLGAAAGAVRRYVHGARDRVDEVFDTARSVRDERWLYIRNYRPHLSWAPPESYSDASSFRRELLALARAGRLGTGPTAWLAPTRPREELYDTIADPYQLRNLAAETAKVATLGRLRAALRAWLVEIRDVAFLTEDDVAVRAGTQSPFEMARRPGAYPFERVLAAAELVGDPAAVAQQRAWLSDPDTAVRTWAAVGLTANAAGAKQARADLERALADRAPAVRIEAARALLNAMEHPAALARLGQEMKAENLDTVLQAARALELLGDPAKPLLPQLRARHALAVTREADSFREFYLRMSLGSWLARYD